MKQRTRSRRRLTVSGAVATVTVSMLITLCVLDGSCDWVVSFWCWLTKDESGSTTLRNVGLVIGALVALVLTVRRIKVADRQAETAQQRLLTAQQGLLHDRYQKSSEMLGGRLLAVRLGGVYALQQLAMEHSEPYLPLVVRQYCAFVRRPFESNDGETGSSSPTLEGDSETLREDVRAVMGAIVVLGSDPKTCEELSRLSLDLSGANLFDVNLSDVNLSHANLSNAKLFLANLSGANLSGANLFRAVLPRTILSNANLSWALLVGANLSGANLSGADLSGAHLAGANLSGAELCGANLSDAHLSDTNLSGANLSGAETLRSGPPLADLGRARGLTQDQLDRACADPGDPPDLRDALSPEGSPLSWRGSPCRGSGT